MLSIDNQLLTWRIYEGIAKFYFKTAAPLPQRAFNYKLIRDYTNIHKQFVDYMYYTVPIEKISQAFSEFPSSYVGQYAVFDALKTLLPNDYNAPINRVRLSKDHAETQIEKSVDVQKKMIRNQYKIDDDATVFFVAPGSEAREAEFCIDTCRKGISEFIYKYSTPTSLSPKAAPKNKFVTFLSLLKGCI